MKKGFMKTSLWQEAISIKKLLKENMMKKQPNRFFPFRDFFRGRPQHLRSYWQNLFESTRKRMTRGSWNISKIISWARKDNWRRGREKKK